MFYKASVCTIFLNLCSINCSGCRYLARSMIVISDKEVGLDKALCGSFIFYIQFSYHCFFVQLEEFKIFAGAALRAGHDHICQFSVCLSV